MELETTHTEKKIMRDVYCCEECVAVTMGSDSIRTTARKKVTKNLLVTFGRCKLVKSFRAQYKMAADDSWRELFLLYFNLCSLRRTHHPSSYSPSPTNLAENTSMEIFISVNPFLWLFSILHVPKLNIPYSLLIFNKMEMVQYEMSGRGLVIFTF